MQISPTKVQAQLSCATVERFETTTFARCTSCNANNVPVATTNNNGWQGSGSGNIDVGTVSNFFLDDNNTQSLTNAITNANLSGTGAVLTMSISASNGTADADPYMGDQSDLIISYGGVEYARFSTTNGSATVGSGKYYLF